MNNQNWNPRQRSSLPQQAQHGWDYSTQYSGNSGRAASVSHVQYQNYSSQQPYYSEEEQHGISNQLQYSQSKTWPGGYGFTHSSTQQQRQPANSFELNEIYAHVRPVDEESWNVANAGASYDIRQPQSFQPWNPIPGQRAHTIAGDALSPVLSRAHLHTPTRTSVPSFIDSGLESSNTSSQDVSKYAHSSYDYPPSGPPLFNGPVPHAPGSIKSETHALETTKRRRRPKEEIPPCSVCLKQSNNQSDARKHQLQHEKPHRCLERPCNRRLGFATKNDLERHRKSVHCAKPSVGKQTGHICHACVTANPNAIKKWWPRLDNFKAHIERKHKEWDKDTLAKLSEAPRPQNAITESGYGGSQPAGSVITEDQAYQQELMSPLGMAMSRHGSTHGDMALFSPGTAQFEALAGVGEGPLGAETFDGSQRAAPRHHDQGSGSVTDGLLTLHDAAVQQYSPVDSIFTSPAVYHGRVPSIQIDPPSFAGSLPTFNDGYLDRSSAKRLKTEGAPRPAKAATVQDNRNEGGDWHCQYAGCNESRKRECDLRKHHKRHTRPYGCTFPNCYKRFGSRNDWKRHENSQHTLLEMWRCGLLTANNDVCGRLISQKSTFIGHLEKRHGLEPKSIKSEECVKSMHLGREGHRNFWCGFCNKLIPQPDSSQQDSMQKSAWNIRCQHVGDHFDKDKKVVDDWVCIEHNKKKGLITKENSKKLKTRYREGKAEEEEGLPDDGIPSKFESDHPTKGGYSNTETKTSTDLGMQASNKRKFEDVGDVDADGVSDCD